METVAESWLFAVFMWIIVLIFSITVIRELWARRKMPRNPRDKEIRRKLIIDNIKFFLGGDKKNEGDNPMNHREEDGDFT